MCAHGWGPEVLRVLRFHVSMPVCTSAWGGWRGPAEGAWVGGMPTGVLSWKEAFRMLALVVDGARRALGVLNRAEPQSLFSRGWVCTQEDLDSIEEVDISETAVIETFYCLVSLWFAFIWLYGSFSVSSLRVTCFLSSFLHGVWLLICAFERTVPSEACLPLMPMLGRSSAARTHHPKRILLSLNQSWTCKFS